MNEQAKTMAMVLGFSAFVGVIGLMLAELYVGSYAGRFGYGTTTAPSPSSLSSEDADSILASAREQLEQITKEEEQRPTKGDGFYVLVQGTDTDDYANSNITQWSGIVRGSDFVPHNVTGTADEYIPLTCAPGGTGYIVTMESEDGSQDLTVSLVSVKMHDDGGWHIASVVDEETTSLDYGELDIRGECPS